MGDILRRLKVLAPDEVFATAQVPVHQSLLALRREIANAWLQMTAEEVPRHYAGRVGKIHQMVCSSGLQQYPSLPEDVEFSRELRTKLSESANPGAGTLLAALLYLAPHEFPHIIEFSAVPNWLRGDYTSQMLASPPLFLKCGAADDYCDFMLRWVTYLRDFIQADPYCETSAQLAHRFGESAQFHPVYFNSANVRNIFRARAQILEMSLEGINYELNWKFPPRQSNRRIKIGILALNFSPNTETFATLPVYRHLDRSRFEVSLFALRRDGNALEQFCAKNANRFVHLPAGLQAQTQMIRDADLDLIYLGTNVTAASTDATALALHRLARVQVAGICSCVTTGMRNVDCFLSGNLAEPPDGQSHYTEKLYMIDGPAHCFDFGTATLPAAAPRLRREAFGIARDAIVFASGANFHKILPELEDVWIRILSSVPNSLLLLYPFNPNWHGYAVDAFMARLSATLRRHEIDPRRLVVFESAPDRSDVISRLLLSDIYLDSFPFCGATSLLDPLLARLPTVVMDGTSHRTLQGPAILRSLDLGQLVAKDVNEYIRIAIRLAANQSRRNALRKQIDAKMRDEPAVFDGSRYAEKVGYIFEQIWQDYCAGRLTHDRSLLPIEN